MSNVNVQSSLMLSRKSKHSIKNKNKTQNGGRDNREYSIDDLFKFIDLYFKQKNVMYTHLYNSFDKLLDEDIPNFLKNNNGLISEKITNEKVYKYRLIYEDISIKPPFIETEDEIMYPQDARTRKLTYGVNIVATIKQVQEITDIASGEVTTKVIEPIEYEYPITSIPIMVRSKYCSLNLKKGYDKSECKYDPGGYFIVTGSEKVVMTLERMIDNRPLVFIKKDSNSTTYNIQVNSKSYKTDMMQVINIRIKKNNVITIRAPILNEIPVFVLLQALGLESDMDILNYIVYDKTDMDMINLVRISLENSKIEMNGKKIISQEEAINYLTTKMRFIRRYNETDKNIKQQEKKIHLMQQLKENLLPHVEENYTEKAYYLGYMINRLLQAYLGRIKPDDRDNFVNKRFETPGVLILELFKKHYNKMLAEVSKFFKKRNPDDENPLNVINQIKPNIIKQGLKTALLTGSWNKRKGVAQMLPRLSYLQTISTLRRFNSPTVEANNKLTGPRHLHPSQPGSSCYIETSEGAKVGLVKNLSLIGTFTVMKNSQYDDLKAYLKPKVENIQDINPRLIKNYSRVLLNGEIIGLTDNPRELYEELKTMKYNQSIDPMVGIAHDIRSEIESKDLRINCDSGRIVHPVIRVENNQVMLTKEITDLISIDDKDNVTKITNWNNFLVKYPGVIEFIDSDEQANAMVAMYPNDVKEMRIRMEESANKITEMTDDEIKDVLNRYDDLTYIKYTHCEIHPSLLLGAVVTNIPFSQCNQGPRNIFQYSQARQAMGIYATNYRDRLDISYILYHTQRPIVTTRTMKYVNSQILPAGENVIVAIAAYTG